MAEVRGYREWLVKEYSDKYTGERAIEKES